MRTAPEIFDVWDRGGPFIGTDKPCSRFTVEETYYLTKTAATVGKSKYGPYRWFQRADTTDQIETEIPNVASWSMDASIDADAATCNITINNQWMDANNVANVPGQLGQPGYLTHTRGVSPDAQARWSHEANEWENVLTPNALIRQYEGFGGHDKTIADAVTDGNLIHSGTWLVDEVTVDTGGKINLKCRDMAKLLLDQQLYPPLIPKKWYPSHWCRFRYVEQKIDNSEKFKYVAGDVNPHYGCSYGSSSNSGSDVWYGTNAAVHGHRPSDAFDGNANTFWLSVGNSQQSAPYAVEWIEMCTDGSDVNQIYVHPWGGNYQMYVSVFEEGEWVGSNQIPYATGGVGIYTGANTAQVPYVMQAGVPWEQGQWYALPRHYKAEKIRVTFTNLVNSQWGPYHYRAGVRELAAKMQSKVNITPVVTGGAFATSTLNANNSGYWQVRNNGQVNAFGDAHVYAVNASTPHGSAATSYGGSASSVNTLAIRGTKTAEGYYTLDSKGRITAYGDAHHYGDMSTLGVTTNNCMDFALTPSGQGYWIVTKGGRVYEFGDAVHAGNGSPAAANDWTHGIESHPTDAGGYWLLRSRSGTVDAIGSVTDYGSPPASALEGDERYTAIKRNADGTGYWVVSGSGEVFAFGACQHKGDLPEQHQQNWAAHLVWDIIPNGTNSGYALPTAYTSFKTFGNFEDWGSVEEGHSTLRRTGNYKDYAGIVRRLLRWSGWVLFTEPFSTTERAPVYGNIEDTGAYSPECLPDDIFDKKPVMDAITTIKEIVGYIFYIDGQGGAHFESPNWWAPGNFDEVGVQTNFIPEIDERVHLTDYATNFNDTDARSVIIIAEEDPIGGSQKGNVVTKFRPYTRNILKGMVKPALWTNGVFQSKAEQKVMAELIAMHIWFASRTGSVSCVANPAIGINDQVRILERQTGETYIHYVRGVSRSHDLQTGEYTMTLTTHWLGDTDDWAIVDLGTGIQRNGTRIITTDL